MVFYNESALDDIEEIFAGLLEWRTLAFIFAADKDATPNNGYNVCTKF
jgi:hypothetical protein